MESSEINGLNLLRFKKIAPDWPLIHALSSRTGGVSPSPFASLNMGFNTGDRPENVICNRKLLCAAAGLPQSRFAAMRQDHTANIKVIKSKNDLSGFDDPQKALSGVDAMVTNLRGTTLMAMSADCAVTLFYDPVNNALATVHSGWRGAFLNIHSCVVKTMAQKYGTRPEDLFAGIGPCISVENYEVGSELIEKLQKLYPADTAKRFYRIKHGKYFLSLESLLEYQMESLGVKNIEKAGMCTFASSELFYSYRRDGPRTGRFGLFTCLS
ncbi:MAG: peptidoglycan editing factor PgeF [bacterium]